MSVEMPLNEDHEVLGSEFCSGYTDALGRWNAGFYCPPREDVSDALFCCGGATYKYCCTQREHATDQELGNLPLILGAALGATAALAIIILVSCCCCSCCALYKSRNTPKQANNGPVYRMQTSSTASGVANMYSFSNQNSLATTPIESSQIMVELEPGGGAGAGSVGRTGTMGRGNTFSGARTLQRNGTSCHDAPPPYEAGKPGGPPSHHTLPHQRHHHQHHQQQQHPQQQQQHLYPPDSPPQARQHFTLPRSHHGMQSQTARRQLRGAPHGHAVPGSPRRPGLRARAGTRGEAAPGSAAAAPRGTAPGTHQPHAEEPRRLAPSRLPDAHTTPSSAQHSANQHWRLWHDAQYEQHLQPVSTLPATSTKAAATADSSAAAAATAAATTTTYTTAWPPPAATTGTAPAFSAPSESPVPSAASTAAPTASSAAPTAAPTASSAAPTTAPTASSAAPTTAPTAASTAFSAAASTPSASPPPTASPARTSSSAPTTSSASAEPPASAAAPSYPIRAEPPAPSPAPATPSTQRPARPTAHDAAPGASPAPQHSRPRPQLEGPWRWARAYGPADGPTDGPGDGGGALQCGHQRRPRQRHRPLARREPLPIDQVLRQASQAVKSSLARTGTGTSLWPDASFPSQVPISGLESQTSRLRIVWPRGHDESRASSSAAIFGLNNRDIETFVYVARQRHKIHMISS